MWILVVVVHFFLDARCAALEFERHKARMSDASSGSASRVHFFLFWREGGGLACWLLVTETVRNAEAP
jgi:hypothetical protein